MPWGEARGQIVYEISEHLENSCCLCIQMLLPYGRRPKGWGLGVYFGDLSSFLYFSKKIRLDISCELSA